MSAISTTSTVTTVVQRLVYTTPRRMIAALSGAIAAILLMGAVLLTTYTSIQNTSQTVGKDAAPSIIASDHIQASAADADASAMNAVLSNEPVTGPSWMRYRADMNSIHNDLITASQNITYGNEERTPIMTLEQELGVYEYTIGQTLGEPLDKAIQDAYAGHRIFQQYIQPASVALNRANFKHLDEKYQAHRNAIAWLIALVWFTVVLVIGVLVGIQFYLFRRTHRVLNRGFLAATAIMVVFAVYTLSTLSASETQLQNAKQNSFDSINALWSARAIAYDMNADESLYLLHHNDATALQHDENDYSQSLKQITSVAPDQAIKDATSGQHFGGYLGDEMANITYPGERAAALATVKAWGTYASIDEQIRQSLAQGDYQQALTIDLGTQPGQSDWAFSQFDSALGQVIDINQKAFDRQVNDAFALLRPFPIILSATLVALIVAAFFGMKPRLDEYTR